MSNLEISDVPKAIVNWLEYEKLCGRSEIFSEALLSYPIAEYINLEYPRQTKRGRLTLSPIKRTKAERRRLPRVTFAQPTQTTLDLFTLLTALFAREIICF